MRFLSAVAALSLTVVFAGRARFVPAPAGGDPYPATYTATY